MDHTDERPLDLLIIGAGLYGIYAANTYLRIHSSASIKVLDGDDDAGGVWSRSRLYPKFWSQTGARLSGFPDVPFTVSEDAPRYHDLFEAKHLTTYLEDYISHHEYNGSSLRERFVFNCWVTKISKEDNVWRVHAKLHGQDVSYASTKLIIATGQNSIPSLPRLPGRESFKGPIIHQKDFGRSRILTPDEENAHDHTDITVVGGSKSASDIVYAAASDTAVPRKVNWVISDAGSGPLILSRAQGFGKYKSLPELGSIRAMASFSSANPFRPESWWSWFLHKTAVGDWLLDRIWGASEKSSKATANYHGREGALPGFEKLETQTNMRWRSGHVGLLQNDDFWDVVAKKVQVHRGEVSRLEDGIVVLGDGTRVETDMLLCATGWRQGYSSFDAHEAAGLGLPVRLEEKEVVGEMKQHWAKLEEDADRKVLTRWPYLAQTSEFYHSSIDSTPYRLYNLTTPPNDQSIAFLGVQTVPNNYHTALAQTLYAIAVLDNKLSLPPVEEIEESISFMNRWCAWRYPLDGWKGNVLDYEMVSFTDHLLEDLGLNSHRSKESWWRDLTDPVLAADYAGLVDEFWGKYYKESE
ncbi:uncharacterized protein LTR77_009446 [Saxophila tyrrhenica]|uniref:Uncharacterized protein n=1 Tax=Saxophila tyrrhenica TaxID=1690608 RepID=A0AAV9P1J2_9PEZI|nr:hypothetical protein LTR77_009446 [Saxophila tyrrhenica]